MIVSENGLCRVMKLAYKSGGYRIIPVEGVPVMVLAGNTWAVRLSMAEFPRKALGLMATHAGCIPEEPILVRDKAPNQFVLHETALDLLVHLEQPGDGFQVGSQLPVIYKEEWQLYRQTEFGSIRAFSIALLGMLDPKWCDMKPRIYEEKMGVWTVGEPSVTEDVAVYIMAGKFKPGVQESLDILGQLQWEAGDRDTEETKLDNCTLDGFEEED